MLFTLEDAGLGEKDFSSFFLLFFFPLFFPGLSGQFVWGRGDGGQPTREEFFKPGLEDLEFLHFTC